MPSNPFDQFDSAPAAAVKTSNPQEFAKVYGPAAERAATALGIDPSFVLGQWGLETGWGKSVIPGTNNLGNIKDFAGGGVGATDNMTGSRDKYRAYDSPEAFADDFVSLVQRKYPDAVGAKDPLSFATALKAGGYAEDPRYVDKVVQASRMAGATPNPVMKAVGNAVEAVIPSANAAEAPPAGANPFDQFDATPEEPAAPKKAGKGVGELAYRALNLLNPAGAALNVLGGGDAVQDAKNVAGGAIRGAGSIGSTIIRPFESKAENEQRRREIDSGLQLGIGAQPDSGLYQGAKLGAEIAGTSGVGGAIAAPVRAAGLPALATAIGSGGAQGGNMLTRMLGGAVSGGATAGLIDPSAAGTGAVIGGAMPPLAKGVSAVGNALGSLVRPFSSGGQDRIVGDTLRRFASDPTKARAALENAVEMVPGSAPTTATAGGDDGLAALSRALQNSSPEYASASAARQTAQNQARTAALEDVAGNTGKIDIAKAARDATTGPMREQALNAAGKVESAPVLQALDDLIADPNNAGQLAQQALNQFRGRINQFSKDGSIDARALYAIRKDINDVLGGKLQGDAGNIRYAAGQLSGVKNIIDDAIDQAGRAVPSAALGPTKGAPNWKGYLQTYAQESVPIRQMERLDEILKSVQTGTVDSQGGAVLSAAKLNNILKNQGSDLAKDLSPKQLDILRRIQADLNASQIANNTGRAVGSNTVQNLAQNQILQGTLGKTLGGSTAATSTLGRLLQLPYGGANKQIQERLGSALLDPKEAARLLQQPENNRLLQLLTDSTYRTAPALSAR